MTREEFSEIYSNVIRTFATDPELVHKRASATITPQDQKAILNYSAVQGWRDGKIQEPMLNLALYALLSEKEMADYFENALHEFEAKYPQHQNPMAVNYYPMALSALKKFVAAVQDVHAGEPLEPR